jgi:hypothetical protein
MKTNCFPIPITVWRHQACRSEPVHRSPHRCCDAALEPTEDSAGIRIGFLFGE